MGIENHFHIRHTMLYHFKKGWNTAQIHRDFNELFEEGTKIQVETIQEVQIRRFKPCR